MASIDDARLKCHIQHYYRKLPNGHFPNCPKASLGLPGFLQGVVSFIATVRPQRATEDPRPAAQQHHRIYAMRLKLVYQSNVFQQDEKQQKATDPPELTKKKKKQYSLPPTLLLPWLFRKNHSFPPSLLHKDLFGEGRSK